MGRKDDLERNIRECYAIISRYEVIQRDTDRPEERDRAGRMIGEQWELVEGYLDEYLPLCRRLGAPMPDDIWEIAARFRPLEEQAETTSSGPPLTQPQVADSTELPVGHLPIKAYRELVGRDALIGDIMSGLRDPVGKWIVAIDGMGGIGKTALAREVADRCLSGRLFDEVVWEQASREEFTGAGHREGIGTLTTETALDAIGRQLGAFDVPRLTGAEKEARVRALLRGQRVLVVLDNLETAKESQNEIAGRLHPLLDPSKAFLTSRHRFKGDVYAIHLSGLDEGGALRFIRQEAEEKNIGHVAAAETDELGQVARSTGGSPLALKLVVGQLGHLPLETVLGQLREVRLPEGEADEDDYVRFYKFIFFPSWQLLSDDGKKLLISMSHFAPGVGGTFEAVKATSGLAENVLTRSIGELWRLSFLEVGESPSLKQTRYYLHALTQCFVLSDIVKVLE
jgi:hypothetical protein